MVLVKPVIKENWCWGRDFLDISTELNTPFSGIVCMVLLLQSSKLISICSYVCLLWKKPRCWGRLRARGEEGNRRWDGCVTSLTQWTWVWAKSEREWMTGKPGMLQSMGSQRVGHDWATEQQQLSSALRCELLTHFWICLSQIIWQIVGIY